MKHKRKRIFNNPVERARRIKANFAMYDGIKDAIKKHDQLDADFGNALLKDRQ